MEDVTKAMNEAGPGLAPKPPGAWRDTPAPALFAKKSASANPVPKELLSADEVMQSHGITAEVAHSHAKDATGKPVSQVIAGASRFSMPGKQSELHDDSEFVDDLMQAHKSGTMDEFKAEYFPRNS